MTINQTILDAIVEMGSEGKNAEKIARELNLTFAELRTLSKKDSKLNEALEIADANRKQFRVQEAKKRSLDATDRMHKQTDQSIQLLFESIQEELDEVTYQYFKAKEKESIQRKFTLLNEFTDFNCNLSLTHLTPLFVSFDSINFILKYNNQIKRKFTLIELIEFSKMLKLLKMLKIEPDGFDELKRQYSRIKILA